MKQQTEILSNVLVIRADGRYTGESFANDVQQFINASVRIAKRSALHTFKVIPQRWVVECSFANLSST